jgi:hypothetical protein
VGIIACVEVTTTTTVTTPITTIAPSSPATTPTTTSGTTTLPTSVQTTSGCQKQMAQLGTVYVSSVTYSVQPVKGTNNADLTNPTSNGVTFQSVPSTNGLLDTNGQPLYTIDLTFNPAGVNSLSSVLANVGSNVNEFSVEFYGLSNRNQLITSPSGSGTVPVSYSSTYTNSQASIVTFPNNAPSDLSGIRIIILSTTDNE